MVHVADHHSSDKLYDFLNDCRELSAPVLSSAHLKPIRTISSDVIRLKVASVTTCFNLTLLIPNNK